MDSKQDILIPKEQVRKVSPDQVEILGSDEPTASPKNPFEGTPFAFKNVKVISSGPMVFLLPLLIPILLVFMLLLFIPLMIFGKRAIVKSVMRRP